MKKNMFGTVMAYYQKKYDLQQSAICEGICVPGTLSKAKRRKRDVDFLIVESLLARVGQDATQFELMLSDEDIDLWMRRQEIKWDMWGNNTESVEEKIEQYKRDVSGGITIHALQLHEQFWRYYETKLAKLMGRSEKTICEHAGKALALTRDVNAMPDKRQKLYTPMEMELLLTLVSHKYGEWGKAEKAEECLKRIRDYIDFYYPEEGLEDAKGVMWMELLKIEEQENKWEAMLSDIEKAIADMSRGTDIFRLAQIRFLKAELLERMGNGAESKEECKMAYCIFEVMGREEQVREVEEFCQEKLGWRITI